MNTKTLLLAIFIFLNFQIVSAQNTIDTTITIHAHTSFPGDDQASRLMVINDVFDALTHKWSVTVDMYGRISTDNCKDDFNKMKSSIHFSNLYKKQIVNGTWDVIWVKGDSVKNGYWIQYDFDSDDGISKVCEGFVVNGLRENKWIEYDDGIKIGEGNYLHGKREGVWKMWQETDHRGQSYYEITGNYKNGLKQGEWLTLLYYPETNTRSSAPMKKEYLNDTLVLRGAHKKAPVLKENNISSCHPCDLLEEKNLIYISVRSDRENIYQVLALLDSLDLDLYSDKVIKTYKDKNGKDQFLTVREHNQYMFINKRTQVPRGDGIVVSPNILVAQKKHGIVDGYNDKTLVKLRASEWIGITAPLCTYTYGPDKIKTRISVRNLSVDDEAAILKALHISPHTEGASSDRISYYDIQGLSAREMEILFKLLCKSNTVTNVYCIDRYIVNY